MDNEPRSLVIDSGTTRTDYPVSPQPPRPSLGEEIKAAQLVLAELHEQINSLESALQPVMFSPMPTDTLSTVEESDCPDYAMAIRQVRRSAMEARDRIATLHERLGL